MFTPSFDFTAQQVAERAIPDADATGKRDSSDALNAWIRTLCSERPSGSSMVPVERVVDLNAGLYVLPTQTK